MKDSDCFACAPVTEPRSEVAWKWHPPRVLCRAHTTKVRTIDGELLFDRGKTLLRHARFRGGGRKLLLERSQVCLRLGVLRCQTVARLLDDARFLFFGLDSFRSGFKQLLPLRGEFLLSA